MTNKLTGPRFRGDARLDDELYKILTDGNDLLGYFSRHLSPAKLCAARRAAWELHEAEVTRRYDPTCRAMSWWWFSAPPPDLRVEFGTMLSKTKRRKALLVANLLDVETAEEAKRKVYECEHWTGLRMAQILEC